jgi:predicted O-methyltransferase YrrM
VPALSGPFDLILQDGDKLQYEPLLHPLVELLAPQGLLVSDDVLFPIMELPRPVEHWKQAMTNYNRTLAKHPSLRTVWLPIGDGVAVSIKHV